MDRLQNDLICLLITFCVVGIIHQGTTIGHSGGDDHLTDAIQLRGS